MQIIEKKVWRWDIFFCECVLFVLHINLISSFMYLFIYIYIYIYFFFFF